MVSIKLLPLIEPIGRYIIDTKSISKILYEFYLIGIRHTTSIRTNLFYDTSNFAYFLRQLHVNDKRPA